MIDITNTKVAVFDFDDTLAIHKNKNYANTRNNDYYIKARLNPYTFYATIEPCYVLNQMQNLITYLRDENVKMYCLSGMRCNLHALAKQVFIQNHYGSDIELLMAKSQEMKLDVLDMLKTIHNCKSNNLLYIDDYKENIQKAKELGYIAIYVKEIANVRIKDGSTLFEYMND